MTEERFYVKKVTKEERPKLFSSVGADYKYFIVDKNVSSMIFNFGVNTILADKVCDLLNKQDNDNKFLFRIINFFAKNPMTKYSSIEELFEEMRMLDEMGLL